MRSLRMVLTIVGLVLVCPPWVLAQSKVFSFSWYTECQNRFGVSQNRGAAGIATLTPSSNGYQLHFTAPANEQGSGDVDVFGPNDVAIQNLAMPNGCGLPQAPPAPRVIRGSVDDPGSFEFGSLFQGGGERLLVIGAATKTIVVPQINSPLNGATVTGTTTMVASIDGVSTRTPLAYRFFLDGTEVAQTVSETSRASVSWDSRRVADGSHTVGVTVSDRFGTILASGINRPVITVANGGGALGVALTSPHEGDTVTGTSWAVIWVNGGTSGASYTYTLQLDGQTVATASTTSTGPVSTPWNTKAFLNGTHTLSATVRDNAGKTGSAKLGVLIRN